MTLDVGNVTIDCADPLRVAAFWSAALGRPLDEGASEAFASVGTEDHAGPGLFFMRVPEAKSVKNRVHLDLRAEDREAEVARLVALGAVRRAEHDEQGLRWTTLVDVEGNEFCVS